MLIFRIIWKEKSDQGKLIHGSLTSGKRAPFFIIPDSAGGFYLLRIFEV
jgi:hypothetical protein